LIEILSNRRNENNNIFVRLLFGTHFLKMNEYVEIAWFWILFQFVFNKCVIGLINVFETVAGIVGIGDGGDNLNWFWVADVGLFLGCFQLNNNSIQKL